MIAMVASLFSGLFFLFKDSNTPGSRRALRALGVRISLAVTLLLLVAYGFCTDRHSFALTLLPQWE